MTDTEAFPDLVPRLPAPDREAAEIMLLEYVVSHDAWPRELEFRYADHWPGEGWFTTPQQQPQIPTNLSASMGGPVPVRWYKWS